MDSSWDLLLEILMNDSSLNIFRQTKPIQAVIYLKTKNKIKLFGFAFLTEEKFLNVQFPSSSWPRNGNIDWQKNIFIYLEDKNNVISIYATLQKKLSPGNLLVKPVNYVQYRDRRDSQRVSVENILAHYQPINEKGSPIKSERNVAQAANISSSGILLQAREVIKPDQRLSMEITLPEKDQTSTICCTGKVIRMALQPNGTLEVALRFEDIQQQDQEYLTEFCQSHRFAQ